MLMFPSHVRLGPLISTMASNAAWLSEDEFPSHQRAADEVERVLSFAEVKGQFERFLPQLKGPAMSRNSALAELRVAYYFDRNQFHIVEWEPPGEGLKKGEFAIEGPSHERIFVEIKNPGWRGELREEEVVAGRRNQPKNINGEARFVGSWQNIQQMMDRAYPKFAVNQRNLLVIVDDFFVSLQYGPEWYAGNALYSCTEGRFANRNCERLGAAAFFWVETDKSYDIRLYLNPFALGSTAMPEDFSSAFHGEVFKDVNLPPPDAKAKVQSSIVLTDLL